MQGSNTPKREEIEKSIISSLEKDYLVQKMPLYESNLFIPGNYSTDSCLILLSNSTIRISLGSAITPDCIIYRNTTALPLGITRQRKKTSGVGLE